MNLVINVHHKKKNKNEMLHCFFSFLCNQHYTNPYTIVIINMPKLSRRDLLFQNDVDHVFPQ